MRILRTITLFAIIIIASLTSLFAQQKGKASYYSKRATGARTASGSRLHHDSLECAHRTHPFGTLLLVKNPANGKEVVVKVVDRGPHRKGRIIDLTYEAARRLGIIAQGIASVEITVYHPNSGVPFPLEKEELPEFDLEITPHRTDSIIPAWQRKDGR